MTLRLDGVRFRHPGSRTWALDGLSLAAPAGAVTWLAGPLGAGCSTALLVAAGLAPRVTGGIREGTVRLWHADPGAGGLVGRLAYVTANPAHQLSGVAETVWQEVAFAPANLGWPVERIRAAVDAALDRLGLAALHARDPRTLSGGELQRVVLAAMLVLAPAAWLLDEPASALDAAGRDALAGLLRSEAARGAVVVVASADADWMAGVADQLVVVRAGRAVLAGAPAALLAGEAIWADGGPGSTSVAALARAVASRAPGPRTAPPWPVDVASAVARWR